MCPHTVTDQTTAKQTQGEDVRSREDAGSEIKMLTEARGIEPERD